MSEPILGFAALLSWGVVAWLHLAHSVAAAHADTLVGHLTHVTRDGLLAFPLALVALGIGRWSANRCWWEGPRALAWLGPAAIISLTFSVLLVPAAGVHELLDRMLAPPLPSFHGRPPLAGLEGATDVVGVTLHGLRDALVAHVAAFLLMLAGLIVLARVRGIGHRGAEPRALGRAAGATAGRLIVPIAIILAGVGAGVAHRSLASGDDDHRFAAHALSVTDVAAGADAEIGDWRLAVHSARWVREPDRLYVQFTVENVGGQARTFARQEFRLQGRSGPAWTPLADNFPAVVVGPREHLTTMLIFEVPEPARGLDLVWSTGTREAHIPIGDNDARGRPPRRPATRG